MTEITAPITINQVTINAPVSSGVGQQGIQGPAGDASPAETTATIGTLINGAAAKSPVDADKFAIWNSVGGLLAACTWTGIKVALKTYFDTLYQALVTPGASGNVLTSDGTVWTSSDSVPVAIAAKLPKSADIEIVTGTTATVLTSWNGKRVRFTSATAVTLTIPATTGFTAGFQCSLFNDSANAVDLSFSGTVVGSGTKIAQKKGATLRMDDVFRATGGLS